MAVEMTPDEAQKYESSRLSKTQAATICEQMLKTKAELASGESMGKWSIVQDSAWEAPVSKGGQVIRHARVSRYSY